MKHFLMIIGISFLITSCFEINTKFYINPDRSGKAEMNYTVPLDPMGMGTDLGNPKEKAYEELANIIKDLENIDAWSGLSYEYSSDSSFLTLKGIAYFKDYQKVKGEGLMPYKFYEKNGNTYFGIGKKLDSLKELAELKEVESKDLNMTEKELQDTIKTLKRNAKMGIGMMSMILSSMEIETEYILGANLKTKQGKSLKNDNSFKIAFDGAKIQSQLNDMVQDDEYWENLIRRGEDFNLKEGFDDNSTFAKKMFQFLSDEQEDISELKVEFTEALFDYDAEVNQARENWKKWEGKLKKYME